MNITIRTMKEDDPEVISRSFTEQGWNKPTEQYIRYYNEQINLDRVTLIPEVEGTFAGYVNVLWSSSYTPFHEHKIPEINDFNVLIKYRRCGIGTKLLDFAENLISERSDVAGIGVGLFSDYGPAQTMYMKRGYAADGRGIFKDKKFIKYGESVVIDDDIALYLTKKLR